MPVVNLMKYAFFVTLEGRAAGGFQEREDVGIDGNDGDEFVDAGVFRFVHVLMAFIACHEAPAAVPFSGGFRAIAEAYLHLFHSDTLCGNTAVGAFPFCKLNFSVLHENSHFHSGFIQDHAFSIFATAHD